MAAHMGSKRKVTTLLLVPNTILWEGLARLLSTTEYRPARCANGIDVLLGNPEFNANTTLFVVSVDACQKVRDGAAPLRELRLLREEYPDAYVIVMGNDCEFNQVLAALNAGADGYIQNSMTCDMLTKSFDLVMAGETVLPSGFTRQLCARRTPSTKIESTWTMERPPVTVLDEPVNGTNGGADMRKLSGREMAIVSRLLEGDSNKSIARRIGLAEATVKTHVKAILRKIGVKNRTQAALWALNNLEVSPEPPSNGELQNSPSQGSNGS
jgi:two-component system nitrate/nitrite response regulator NarL